jgi:hypothetical protein
MDLKSEDKEPLDTFIPQLLEEESDLTEDTSK